MIKKKFLLPLSFAAAAMLTACSSNTTDNAQANASPFIDDGMAELYKNVTEVYETPYFALGIPQGWKVVSFNNEELNTHISVEKLDHSATVTIRIIESKNTIEQSCDLAKQGFDANDTVFSSKPSVQFGTCIIEGKQENKDVGLWMRNYEDNHSSYSMTYSGSLETIQEVLGYLSSDDKLGQLFVRPIAL